MFLKMFYLSKKEICRSFGVVRQYDLLPLGNLIIEEGLRLFPIFRLVNTSS